MPPVKFEEPNRLPESSIRDVLPPH